MDRTARWLGLLLLSGALLARSARAEESEDADDCSKEPSPTSTDAAKGAFRAGQTAFSEGAYGPAVRLWAQAYREDCRAHAILLNLATAHELLGRPDEAIHALRLFNRRAPDSPYVEANLRRIQQLESTSAQRAPIRTRRQPPAPPAEVPKAAPATDADWALPLPLVVAVSGSAMALVGGVLYAEARFASAEAAERCSPTAMCANLQGVIDGERARSRAEVAGWLTATGLATTAAGVVWHLLVSDPPPLDQQPRTHAGGSWRPVVGRQSAVVYWNGTF